MLAVMLALLGSFTAQGVEPTVEQLKARLSATSLNDKPKLCLQIAQRQLEAADKLYASAEIEKAQAALTDAVAFAELARDYAVEAHKHEKHETAIYVLSGVSGTYYGERLEHHVVGRAGDFLYIPAGLPHLPYNLSASEPCVAIVARTDPNDQESVVMLPELDGLHPA